MGLESGEVMLIGILLVPAAALYWVIRLAVRHGRQDAASQIAPK